MVLSGDSNEYEHMEDGTVILRNHATSEGGGGGEGIFASLGKWFGGLFSGKARSSRMQRGMVMIPGKAPKGGTYALRDPETGQVMRTGMAANLTNRKSDHKRDYPGLVFEIDKRSDSRDARRGREQIIHDLYNPPLNVNEPISRKNNSKAEIERLMNEGRKL